MTAREDIAIRIEGLGKRYRLGENHSYRTLRDSLAGLFKGKPAEQSGPSREIWAVKDLTLDVAKGEVLGIIGRNGSGKSTLLKLLSRITQPDAGRIEIDGRVGALLEVGTGFHPELTGRENIYMNGSILGMTRAEIARKFDEIVAFSGVEEFLDTPVKRYSSGMRVRLGFAVAAHLDPEILVVDEVLAVGDAEFQRKCLGRMGEVARAGRTVLFVSHQMEAIQSLCTKAIWLDGGRIVGNGGAAETVRTYLSSLSDQKTLGKFVNNAEPESGQIKVVSLVVHDGRDNPPMAGAPLAFDLVLSAASDVANDTPIEIRLGLLDDTDRVVTILGNEFSADTLSVSAGRHSFRCHLHPNPLVPGRYFVNIAVRVRSERKDRLTREVFFDVMPGDFFGNGRVEQAGTIYLKHAWCTR